ncbi:MAG: hypothetical protein K1X94_19500, partial [Sandaracinaceae bacterium]|nr:hypothetical protein [Sandaracinaceae bacterium]
GVSLEPTRLVVQTDARRLEASELVIAGPSTLAHGLLAPLGDDVAKEIAPRGPGVRAAGLDLGLDALPEGAAKGAVGTREPTYVSVHSATAELAPRGAAVVHAALYLGDRAPRPKEDRAAIEAALDRAIPGWRPLVRAERFAPAALAASARVDAPHGLAGRPATTVGALTQHARGVHLVGDWVGPRGLLLDAVMASALAVARSIEARRSARMSRSSLAESAL